jgi:hypothetical protein
MEKIVFAVNLDLRGRAGDLDEEVCRVDPVDLVVRANLSRLLIVVLAFVATELKEPALEPAQNVLTLMLPFSELPEKHDKSCVHPEIAGRALFAENDLMLLQCPISYPRHLP